MGIGEVYKPGGPRHIRQSFTRSSSGIGLQLKFSEFEKVAER